jgi:integrase
LKKNFSTS